jgi:hypothetical protein
MLSGAKELAVILNLVPISLPLCNGIVSREHHRLVRRYRLGFFAQKYRQVVLSGH